MPSKEEQLQALRIEQMDQDPKGFELQVYYSHWLLDEIAVLSDWFLSRVRDKAEQWALLERQEKGPAEIQLAQKSCAQVFRIGITLGLFDRPMPGTSEETIQVIQSVVSIVGINGEATQRMEEANHIFSQEFRDQKQKRSFALNLIMLGGYLLFSKIIKEHQAQRKERVLDLVSPLVEMYELFSRTLRAAHGMSLPDGSELDLDTILGRLGEFRPPY